MISNYISNVLKIIIDLAKENRREIFLVGGSVRDLYLCTKINDFDFAVDYEACTFAEELSKKIGGTYIVLDEDNDIARLVCKDNDEQYILDFAKYKGNNIMEDLKRRDFTINSMALALVDIDKIKIIHEVQGTTTNIEQFIIDPVGGISDLKNRNIKLTYDKAFIDDPVRMLRGFRLSAKYDFNIGSNILETIHNMRTTILDCAGERVWAELINIFSTDKCIKVIKYMDESRMLETLLPQIQRMKEVGKCTYHTVDSWTHTKNVLSIVNEIIEYVNAECENMEYGNVEYRNIEYISNYKQQYNDGEACNINTFNEGKRICAEGKYLTKEEFKPFISECFDEYILGKIKESFDCRITKAHSKESVLRIAALLHDIGKPDSYSIKNEKVSFSGHAKIGSEIVFSKIKKLKAANREINYLKNMTLHHDQFLGYYNNFYYKGFEDRAELYEIFDKTQNLGTDLILLGLADVTSTYMASGKDEETKKYITYIKYIFEQFKIYIEARENMKVEEFEVIKIIGIENLKQLGPIYKGLYKFCYLEQAYDKERQIQFVREYTA